LALDGGKCAAECFDRTSLSAESLPVHRSVHDVLKEALNTDRPIGAMVLVHVGIISCKHVEVYSYITLTNKIPN